MMQKFKLSIESFAADSKNSKQKQKQNLLNNAQIISKWIDEFDPSTVNDCLPGPIKDINQKFKYGKYKKTGNESPIVPKNVRKI